MSKQILLIFILFSILCLPQKRAFFLGNEFANTTEKVNYTLQYKKQDFSSNYLNKNIDSFIFIDKSIRDASVFHEKTARDKNTYHLFTHGRSGELFINGQWKNAIQIVDFLNSTVNIQHSDFKNLNIYGCEFAKGEKGKQAVAYLEKKLNIKVAASTNITGKDGDWLLEVGNVKTSKFKKYSYNLQCANHGTLAKQDYDCDGVINSKDLDDDNDGILDSKECPSNKTPLYLLSAGYTDIGISQPGGQTKSLVAVTGKSIYAGITMTIEFISPSGSNPSDLIGGDNGSSETYIAIANTINKTQKLRITFSDPLPETILKSGYDPLFIDGESATYLSPGIISAISPPANTDDMIIGTNYVKNPIGGTGNHVTYGDIIYTVDDDVQVIELETTIQTGGTNSASQNGFRLQLFLSGGADCDSDGDGLYDKYDLDSDGDGCPDAIEGGANFIANNSNLQTSSLPGGSNGVKTNFKKPVNTNNGIPTAAGNGQSVGVSKKKAIITIKKNPANVTLCSNTIRNPVKFEAEASINPTSNSIQYQWQLSTDGGTSYSSISGESGTLPGTGDGKTTLNLTGVNSTYNNNKYKVIFTTTNNECPEETTAATLKINTAPTAEAGNDVTINCTNPNAQLMASGGTSYSWSPATGLNNVNIANPTASPNTTTDYTVTVIATNGCSATDTVRVTVDTNKPTANAGSDATINCNDTNAQLTASGGTSYSWSPATGLNKVNIANPIASPNTTTDYTVTVTATNGCSATDTVRVTVDTNKPTANAGTDVTINCADTSAKLTASGGTSYSWSPATGLNKVNIANPIASPNTTTDYTVTVTATNGCSATDTVRVTVDQNKPTANAGTDATINCNDTTAQLMASGGTSYSWSPATGLNKVNIANPIASPSTTTDYTVTVTATNGCSATDTVRITVDTNKPTANAGSDATINCNDTTAQLTASGGTSYSWSPATGLDNVNIANPTASPSTTTDYTVTVTATNGCSSTDTVRVTVDTTAPTANAGADVTINCSNTSETLSATGGVSYSWSPAAGLSDVNAATPVATPNTTTIYTVTVTGANGCTDTDSVKVTVDKSTPTVNAGVDQELNCTTTSVTLDGSNSASGTNIAYQWSTNDGTLTGATNASIATASAIGTYTLKVTNTTTGCFDEDSVTVTASTAKPTAEAGADFTITCSNNIAGKEIGTATTTGYTYLWSPTTGLSNPAISNPFANPTTTTTYEVTVTNSANGCLSKDTVTVTVDNTPPTAQDIQGSTNTLCAQETTTLSTATTGNIVWNSLNTAVATIDASTGKVTAIAAGTANIIYTVTGSNSCSSNSKEYQINVNPLPATPAIIGKSALCVDDKTTLTTTATGTVVWSSSNTATATIDANTGEVTGISAGTTNISYTVTNSSGCSSTSADHQITINPLPATPAITGKSTLCNGDNTTLSTVASGTVVWSSSDTSVATINENTGEVTTLSTGTTNISYTVTDGNSCTSQSSDFSLKVNPLPYFEVTDEQVACSNNLPLVLRVENANDTYTYQWKDPSGNDLGTQTTQEVSIGGKYTVTATKNDGASCSSTKTITVIESSPPATTLEDITVVDSSENNSISINTTTTGNGNYEFALFNEEGTSIIRYYQTEPYFEQLEVGIYTIKIRDRNGCGEVNFTVPVLNFPKFFTPDNDGIKDVWSVEGVTETFFTKRSAVYVFNRHGKVLAKLNANESWNGIYIGKNVIPTDYWYKVELIDKNEKVYRREGNFSLIRE